MGLAVGDAGYRIIGPLASGGMGEVYKAEHVITRRIEAIKVLSGAGTSEESERFLREIQLQASLSHPNIAAVYNAFRVDSDLVMVMELVEGEPLRAILARGRLPLPAAVNYACQALQAIAYAHAHGVIHRDITPSNILVTPQGVVKLTDFGLAKTVAPSAVSQSGTSMGSPHYMSPEQVMDATRASARSDIYSLAAVLYEMVTGRKAFEGESTFLIMQAQVERAPAPPGEIEPSLPPALNAAILKALSKDPQNRFAGADAFRAAIEAAMAPPDRARHTREHRRHGLGVRFLQFAGICAVVLPVAMVMDSMRRHPELRITVPAVHIRLPLPPLMALEPAAAAPPAGTTPPMTKPAPAPARRRPRPVKPPQADTTPQITGQEPAASAEPAEPSRASALPATPHAGEPPLPADVSPQKEQTSTTAGESGEHTSTPSRPADDQTGSTPLKDKKNHNRVWRALGKIVGRMH